MSIAVFPGRDARVPSRRAGGPIAAGSSAATGRSVKIVALLLVLAATSACGKDAGPGEGTEASRTLPVDTAVVETRDLEVTLDAVGTAYASGQVDVRPQVDGTLLEAPFVEGDPIEQGAVLARLDDSKPRASLALVEAQLDSARAKLAVATERQERYRRLKVEDLVSREEYATLDAEQKSAAASVREREAEVRLARRNLEDYTLIAPISGRMGIRYVDVGNYIEAGTVLATLVQSDPVEVLFAVPSVEMTGLEVGQETILRDTLGGELARGKIRVIDPRVDTDTRMVSVKALVANPDDKLRAGQFVGVTLVRERRPEAVVVPEDAILPQQGKTFVYVVKDGVANRREVTLGIRRPGIVEIRAGLQAGEVLVTRGQHRLVEGSKVEPPQKPKAAAGGEGPGKARD
jgi:membrane fusion protein (multidrug efflux system)